jgi:hypothetical protein
MCDPGVLLSILERNAKPDVPRDRSVTVAGGDVASQDAAPLRKYLEYVPRGTLHHIEYTVDERGGDLLVKEVTHRVHEDVARLSEPERLFQSRRLQTQVEPKLVRMPWYPSPALRKTFSVAVVATRADLGAARGWVPRNVCPFDRRGLGHENIS